MKNKLRFITFIIGLRFFNMAFGYIYNHYIMFWILLQEWFYLETICYREGWKNFVRQSALLNEGM